MFAGLSLSTALVILAVLFYFRKELKAIVSRGRIVADVATSALEDNVAAMASENLVELLQKQETIAQNMGITSEGTPYEFYQRLRSTRNQKTNP